MMANTLLANAPMREMKRCSSGIATANPAVIQWIRCHITWQGYFTCNKYKNTTKDCLKQKGPFRLFLLVDFHISEQWWFHEVQWNVQHQGIRHKDGIG